MANRYCCNWFGTILHASDSRSFGLKSLFVCVAGRKREEGALCVERLVVLHKSERKFCNLNKAKSFMFQYFSTRTQFDKSQTAIWKWVSQSQHFHSPL